jgi:uncharacterized protein (TIGR02300 family)
MTLAIKSRGTKRTCQSEDCALPFYDLNRNSFACPNCGHVFDMAVALAPRPETAPRGYVRKTPRTFTDVAPTVEAAATSEVPAEEELADAVTADDETAEAGDTDVILEEQDDSDPVIGIEPVKSPQDD